MSMSLEQVGIAFAACTALCSAVWSVGSVSSTADVALEKAETIEQSHNRLDGKLDKLISEVGKIKTSVAVVRTKVEAIDSAVAPPSKPTSPE